MLPLYGILQGCPLSVVLLNALNSIWARAVEAEAPNTRTAAFVDDTSIMSSKSGWVQSALQTTAAYCALTGQELNIKKSIGYTTATRQMRRFTVAGGKLAQAEYIKEVGAYVTINSGSVCPHAADRLTPT